MNGSGHLLGHFGRIYVTSADASMGQFDLAARIDYDADNLRNSFNFAFTTRIRCRLKSGGSSTQRRRERGGRMKVLFLCLGETLRGTGTDSFSVDSVPLCVDLKLSAAQRRLDVYE
jgi:hypothetical protein